MMSGVCCEYSACAVPPGISVENSFETEAACNPYGCNCAPDTDGVVRNGLGCFCDAAECATLGETVEAMCQNGGARLAHAGCEEIRTISDHLTPASWRKFDAVTGELVGSAYVSGTAGGICEASTYDFGDTTGCSDGIQICDLCGVSPDYPPCPL
jgi:hypothetical protein